MFAHLVCSFSHRSGDCAVCCVCTCFGGYVGFHTVIRSGSLCLEYVVGGSWVIVVATIVEMWSVCCACLGDVGRREKSVSSSG